MERTRRSIRKTTLILLLPLLLAVSKVSNYLVFASINAIIIFLGMVLKWIKYTYENNYKKRKFHNGTSTLIFDQRLSNYSK